MIPTLAPSHSSLTPRPHRCRRVALALAAASCALPACLIADPGPGAPDDGPPPDLSGQYLRTSFVVKPTPDLPPIGIFLVLDRSDQSGEIFTGTLTIADDDGANVEQVIGTLDERGDLSILPSMLGGIAWDELRIAVRDQDGDAVYESGAGHMSGINHTYYFYNEFAQDFEAAPDAFTSTASAVADTAIYDQRANRLLPWQPMHIELRQPVTVEQARSYRVLADGQEVPGETRLQTVSNVVTTVEFVPHAFYPLGTEIQVEASGMENALGLPVTFAHEPIPVMADPGLAGDNLAFEQGLGGWQPMGSAYVADGVADVVPAEGARLVVVETGGTGPGEPGFPYDSHLVGYIDVPVDASELDLSLAVLVPEEVLPSVVTMRLYHDDDLDEIDAIDIYELAHETEVFEPCACPGTEERSLARRLGPVRRQIGLEAFRGQRVFLEMHVEGDLWWYGLAQPAVHALVRALLPIPPPPPPIAAALIIDDIQIR